MDSLKPIFDWTRFAPESIAVLSDLHNEFAPFEFPEGFAADLIVLAGDIHTKGKAAEWAKSLGRPCVLIFGNHDYYGSALVKEMVKAKASCLGTMVAILDDEELRMQNLRILGGTLWTDYKLHGDPIASSRIAEGNLRDPYSRGMSDHRKIRNAAYSKARGSDLARAHARCVRFLESALAEPCLLPTLVATHHAPSRLCLMDSSLETPDTFDPCYASNLDHLMGGAIQAWVHGHVHQAKKQRIGNCLVASNPKGYPGENTGFDMGFRLSVAELARAKALALPRKPCL